MARPEDKWMYNSSRWAKRREDQLTKEPFCFMCEEEGKIVIASIADHKEPHRGLERSFFEGELQSLCEAHHNSVKQSQERSEAGIRRGFNDLGEPLDANHPWNAK